MMRVRRFTNASKGDIQFLQRNNPKRQYYRTEGPVRSACRIEIQHSRVSYGPNGRSVRPYSWAPELQVILSRNTMSRRDGITALNSSLPSTSHYGGSALSKRSESPPLPSDLGGDKDSTPYRSPNSIATLSAGTDDATKIKGRQRGDTKIHWQKRTTADPKVSALLDDRRLRVVTPQLSHRARPLEGLDQHSSGALPRGDDPANPRLSLGSYFRTTRRLDAGIR